MAKDKLQEIFNELSIEFVFYEHPALDNCQEADKLNLKRQGQRTKNLFLRDNYGRRHFLLITKPEKSVDLKALSKLQNISRLGFASPERLQKHLAVKPGSVSLLAIVNDQNQNVEIWIDDELSMQEGLQCHPLNNEETWVISGEDIQSFLSYLKHDFKQLFVPEVGSS